MKARTALIRSLGRLGNVIGVLGVIGSLVFVGLELRQSKTIAVAAIGEALGARHFALSLAH